MRELIRRRPSAAMVVSIGALVLTASGTAVAASKLVSGDSLIEKNSLSGNRLRAHSVTGRQIKLSSLGPVARAAHATIADRAITATNATNATTATNATNAVNATTAQTAQTATSATNAVKAATATTAGSAPIAKLTYVTTSFAVPGDGTPTTGTASCPSGTDATGGGSNIDDTTNGTFFGSFPAGEAGWSATYEDFSGGAPATGTVYAICAPAASTVP